MAGGFGTGISQGLGAASQFIGMMENKRSNDLEQARFDRMYGEGGTVQQDLDIRERQVGVAEQNASTASGQLELARNTPEARYNARLGERPFQMMTTLSARVKEYPELGPAFYPLIEEMKSNPDITRADVIPKLYTMEFSKAFQDGRQAMYEKAVKLQEQGKVREARNYMTLYEATNSKHYERLVDTLTGKPQSMWRTASEMGREGAPQVSGGDKFWDDKTQSWMQRMSDGSYKKIAQAPTAQGRRAIYDANGNLVYEEGPGARTPASNVEKVASLEASIDNLGKMREIITGNPDADLSGFWEWGNKLIDNWDLLGGQDRNRAELRQRTAMSLKFMYDVMGRQLAVQELRKGEAMLPSMSVDEKVNVDRIDNLAQYMKTMLIANYETFKQAGYNYPKPDVMSLDWGSKGVKEGIIGHGEAIEARLKAAGTPPDQIDTLVRQELESKFPGVF